MNNSDAIAVIGMGCRFPGAENIDRFWDNLKNGVESLTAFSYEEMAESGANPSDVNRPEYVKAGFVLEGEDLFDASFFGYSPKEAEIMDPQQRLFLETAWEALEDGGYATGRYDGAIGVFAGSKMSTYLTNVLKLDGSPENAAGLHALVANDKDYLTSRVSFKLNLKGPSITVQSACSTSLVAIHLACDSLLSGACDMTLAGGVSLVVPQKRGYLFQEGLILSPDGHCRAFDANANGMAPGNGVGVVLLKRLKDAVADRDNIYAVILGSAVNNDGSQKAGYTTPGVEGQVEVVREAQIVSGIDPASVSYVEAHGTGTALGDPVEIEALNRVFKAQTGKTGFCAIGSVKTNIGHLDTAAGVAGFIKTVLSLKNGLLPPSLNYERPNPKIDFRNSPFYVNAEPSPWKTNGRPRRAGVSSFGFGGTNAHVVLEQAPEPPPRAEPTDAPLHLMAVSAKDPSALKRQVANYARFLRENPDAPLGDVCFTANAGRAHFPCRFAAIARSRRDLPEQLDAFEEGVEVSEGSGAFPSSPLPGRDSTQALSRFLEDLKGAYLAGKAVDWEAVYSGGSHRRIPMPTYPFSRKRYWAQSRQPSTRWAVAESRDGGTLPFKGQRLACAAPVCQFEISTATDPFLKSHVVHGKTVVPVGACWEMALAAWRACRGTERIALKDYIQHEAMRVGEDEPFSTVQVVLGPDAEGKGDAPFEIFRRREAAAPSREDWRRCASGRIAAEAETDETAGLEDIRARCGRPLDIREFVSGLRAADDASDGGDGPWWFEEIRTGKGEALGKIAFSDGFLAEAGACRLHPSILEPCLQTLFAVPGRDGSADGVFLPVGVEDVRYLSAMPEEVFCHAAVRGGGSPKDSGFVVDFRLFDPRTKPVAQILGVYMRRAPAGALSRNAGEPASYGIRWRTADRERLFPAQGPAERSPGDCWFVLGDRVGVAESLARSMAADDETAVVLYPDGRLLKNGDDIRLNDTVLSGIGPSEKVLEYIFNEKLPDLGLRCKGTIHCVGMEPPAARPRTEEVKAGVFRAYSSAVRLLRAVAGTGRPVTRFCLLTRGAQAVAPEMDTVDVRQAPLWGMRKCLAQEHPELNVRIFDLDPSGGESQVRSVWELIRGGGPEGEIALRGDTFYVPRLAPLPDGGQPAQAAPLFRADAAYLLAGGLGGVGLETAEWLADNGAGSLVLTGRGEPGPLALEKIEALERRGVRVRVEKADVVDPEALPRIVRAVGKSMPPLKGVFHLAGVPGEGDALRQSLEEAERIMAPKVEGAWNLHLATLESDLDHFVLFSSISSLWGGHGLAAYAGANGFLDALARHRRSLGLPGTSVNWGAFAGAGMIAQDEKGSLLRKKSGLESFSPGEALGYFSRVMDLPQACIAKMDWRRFFDNAHLKDAPLFSDLARRHDKTASAPKKASGFLATLEGASGDGRRELLVAYLTRKVSEALGLDADGIAPDGDLLQMGMDSLIFLTLAQTVGDDLRLRIAPHKLFENPTVEALAREFAAELESAAPAPGAPVETAFAVPPDPAGRYEPFDLTDIQQAYWVGRNGITGKNNVACHAYFEMDFDALDVDRYNRAWRHAIDRHDMMRMVVLPDGRQKILETVPEYVIARLDLSGEDEKGVQSALNTIRDTMSAKVADTSRWPLFEVRASCLPEGHVVLHFSIDLLFADVHSIGLIVYEAWQSYTDNADKMSPLEITFRDYVLGEQKYRESTSYKKSKEYWTNRLAEFPSPPSLPTIKSLNAIERPEFVRRSRRFEAEAWSILKNRASKVGLTPSGLLMAVYAEILSRWSKDKDYAINVSLFNRLPVHPQVNDIVGDFTSILCLEIRHCPELSFKARAEKLQKQFWRDMEFRSFSGVQVLRELARRKNAEYRDPMYTVFTSNLIYTEHDHQGDNVFGTPGRIVNGVSQTPQVSIDLQVSELNGSLAIFWDAVEAVFPPGVLDDMFNAFCDLLISLSGEEAIWHRTTHDLLPAYQIEAHVALNATKAPVPSKLLHSLFFEHAAKTPERTAVISSGRTLSYGELANYACRIADEIENKVLPNTLVAVAMEKGWEQVAAVLGILSAGAAYLPVDPDLPEERFRHILEDAKAKVVLGQSRLRDRINVPDSVDIHYVDLLEPHKGRENDWKHIESASIPDDLAYVIYTSGSTGRPKGVMIDHRGAVNTVLDIGKRYRIEPEDRVFSLSNLNFDLSVFDIFGALSAGAAIVMPDPSGIKDPAHWLDMMKSNKVSVWNSVPALMEMLVEFVARETSSELDALRLALLSGDWIPLDLPERIEALGSGIQVVSLGGATEASIWSVLYPVADVAPHWKSIPYGRPMANQRIYVLNASMEECPDWVPGQLYIGGTGLAKGYWRDDEKTGNAFVRHPRTGERLYRTGDLGRYAPEGHIEFLGREDFQVKIGGYRIELGEIEANLMKHPRVSRAAVSVSTHGRHKKLTGYVVLTPGPVLERNALETYLEEKLPAYMVPRSHVFLDELPLTDNGKIDRKALSETNVSDPVSGKESTLPRSKTESDVAGIWREILETKSHGVHDDFFQSGGDSLLATRAVLNLKKHFSVEMPLPKFFELPTIAEQAKYIDKAKTNPAMPADATTIRDLAREADELLDSGVLPGKMEYSAIDEPEHIFLTGATGFLGSFLLEQLLEQTRAKIYCLVRSKDENEGAKRLRQSQARYELSVKHSDLRRVIPISGDLSKPFFGLARESFQRLSDRIDAIYHNGAQTRFSYAYENLKPVNVMGTLEVLKLATRGKIKPVHHISTTSVFFVMGDHGAKTVFESDGLPEEGILPGGYPQSKWVAEKLVRRAMSRGLPGIVYRPGMIAGHSRTGRSNLDDMVCRTIKSCIQTGLAPRVHAAVDVLPVDFASRCIVWLSCEQKCDGRVFHLTNPNRVGIDRIADWIRNFGFDLKTVPYEKWLETLTKDADDSRENALYPLLPLLPGSLPDGLEDLSSTRFDVANTRAAIAGSGMEFPLLDEELSATCLSCFVRSGYIKPPLR